MIRRLRQSPSRLALGLMLALTFSTGIIDAVGFLGLDRVFTGNMTGNVVILGMALMGADELPVVGPVVALVGFLAGAALAGRLLRSMPGGWAPRTGALIALVSLLLASATAVSFLVEPLTAPISLGVTGTLGAAMGLQAGTARHVAVKDVTSVVVTSTITGLAADSWFGARRGQPWPRRIGAIALMLAGAGLGAVTLTVHIGLGLAVGALITLAVAVLGHVGRPRPASDAQT